MFHSSQRNELRDQFFSAWKKHQQSQPLTPLENQIVQVIIEHPEYHAIIENKSKYEDKDFSPDDGVTNPFLHLSLHLAIRDQITTDRPKGITDFFNKQLKNKYSQEQIEHQMMDALVETIWQAQKNGDFPDENQYLTTLKYSLDQ